MLELSTPVKYVKGIGPRIADVLAGKGIYTVGELLQYLPFRYEDRLNPRTVAELRPVSYTHLTLPTNREV